MCVKKESVKTLFPSLLDTPPLFPLSLSLPLFLSFSSRRHCLLTLGHQHSLNDLVLLDQESSHDSVLHAAVAKSAAVRSVDGSLSLLGVDKLSLGHLLDLC